MTLFYWIRRGSPAHSSVETADGDRMSDSGGGGATDGASEDGGDPSRSDRQVRTVGQQQQQQQQRDEEAHSHSHDLEDVDEPSVIVQLAARVQDGTRCRMGSLDMCIQGKCQVSGVNDF